MATSLSIMKNALTMMIISSSYVNIAPMIMIMSGLSSSVSFMPVGVIVRDLASIQSKSPYLTE